MPELIFPGDYIASEEELLPGFGTYAKNGKICSSNIGILEKDLKKREARLTIVTKIPMLQREGLFVIGRVSLIREKVAFIDLIPIESKKFRYIPRNASTVLRAGDIRRGFVKDINDEIRIGDIIRAKIIEVSPYNVNLSTNAPNLGVIKAFCSHCRHALALEGKSLVCEHCGWKERRKITNDYRSGRI